METFHENVFKTFIFCFLASLGIIQIMVAKRSWHGLSIYGGRVRRNVNNALGAGLIIFAYAWYFSNPEHRNMRNIEGFMSLVCLVLGIAAAAFLTAALAAAAEAWRRRRRGGGVPAGRASLKKIFLKGGKALLSGEWEAGGEKLVVIAEPGRGSERLLARLEARLPAGTGFLGVLPSMREEAVGAGNMQPAWGEGALEMLQGVAETEALDLTGATFAGLGWGANMLAALCQRLESDYRPRKLLAIAPVIPDNYHNMVGDALTSNTPLDVADTLLGQQPWRERAFAKTLRLWLPVAATCVGLATLATVFIDIRWKFFSGPLVGLLLSLWVSYFVAARRGTRPGAESWEARAVSRLKACLPVRDGGLLQVVVIPDQPPCAAVPDWGGGDAGYYAPVVWGGVLRGKFLLEEGTLADLVNLIMGRGEG